MHTTQAPSILIYTSILFCLGIWRAFISLHFAFCFCYFLGSVYLGLGLVCPMNVLALGLLDSTNCLPFFFFSSF